MIDGPGGRIACVADVRGNISMFNQIADETDAQAIIHTGDFGFYERSSFERISDRYVSLISNVRAFCADRVASLSPFFL